MEELTKWRMILGGGQADGTDTSLSQDLSQIDDALSALYEFDSKGEFDYEDESPNKSDKGSGSNPSISRWLGDIRKYFPATVVEVLQNDAMKHPELQKKMIFEPEILEKATPDVNLVVTLMASNQFWQAFFDLFPCPAAIDRTKDSACFRSAGEGPRFSVESPHSGEYDIGIIWIDA